MKLHAIALLFAACCKPYPAPEVCGTVTGGVLSYIGTSYRTVTDGATTTRIAVPADRWAEYTNGDWLCGPVWTGITTP